MLRKALDTDRVRLRIGIALSAVVASPFAVAASRLCEDRPLVTSALRVAIIADLNSAYGDETYLPSVAGAVQRIVALKPDLVLSAGDMVAGQWRNLERSKLRSMWRSFQREVADPLYAAGIPLAVTPGNHDASPGFDDDRAAYREAWASKKYLRLGDHRLRTVDMTDYPFNYAVRMRGHVFASIDATRAGPLPADRLEWLRRTLSRPALTRSVFGHVPLAPVSSTKFTEALFDDAFEKLLLEFDVRAYFSGHHHAFYRGLLDGSGVRQVTAGALGSAPRALVGSDTISPHSFVAVDIGPTGRIDLASCSGDDFTEEENTETLPPSISWTQKRQTRRILRED